MYALVFQRERQGGDERRLARALDAVEANGERRGRVLATIGFGMTSSVRGEMLQDEWHAYRRLVIHKGGRHYARRDRHGTVHGAISNSAERFVVRKCSGGDNTHIGPCLCGVMEVSFFRYRRLGSRARGCGVIGWAWAGKLVAAATPVGRNKVRRRTE